MINSDVFKNLLYNSKFKGGAHAVAFLRKATVLNRIYAEIVV